MKICQCQQYKQPEFTGDPQTSKMNGTFYCSVCKNNLSPKNTTIQDNLKAISLVHFKSAGHEVPKVFFIDSDWVRIILDSISFKDILFNDILDAYKSSLLKEGWNGLEIREIMNLMSLIEIDHHIQADYAQFIQPAFNNIYNIGSPSIPKSTPSEPEIPFKDLLFWKQCKILDKQKHPELYIPNRYGGYF
jgi:hypothetical protein